MNGRRTVIIIGAILMAVALGLALWPVIESRWRSLGSAGAALQDGSHPLVIVAQVNTSEHLQLRFDRPNGATGQLSFRRASADRPWEPEKGVDAPGIVLGDGYPVFGTPRFLRVNGLDLGEVLRPLSQSIVDEQADDVSVIRGWGGELAICLWRHGKVVRAYLAGPVSGVLNGQSAGDTSCHSLGRAIDAPLADTARTIACAAALAGCPALRESALDQLRLACEAGEASACDLLLARDGGSTDLWPEIDDLWRWILDVIDASASSATDVQNAAIPPAAPAAAVVRP